MSAWSQESSPQRVPRSLSLKASPALSSAVVPVGGVISSTISSFISQENASLNETRSNRLLSQINQLNQTIYHIPIISSPQISPDTREVPEVIHSSFSSLQSPIQNLEHRNGTQETLNSSPKLLFENQTVHSPIITSYCLHGKFKESNLSPSHLTAQKKRFCEENRTEIYTPNEDTKKQEICDDLGLTCEEEQQTRADEIGITINLANDDISSQSSIKRDETLEICDHLNLTRKAVQERRIALIKSLNPDLFNNDHRESMSD